MFYKKKLLLKKVGKKIVDFTSFAAGIDTTTDDNLMPLRYGKMCYNYSSSKGALQNGLGFNRLCLPKTYDTYEENERMINTSPEGTGILALWHHKYYSNQMNTFRHRVVFHTDNKMLYFFPTINGFGEIYTVFPPDDIHTFNGKIDAINYHLNGDDSLIFIVPDEQKIVTFASTELINIIENAPNLVTIGLHYERLFAVLEGDRKTLMFSANLDPTNWDIEQDGGGFIDMRDERGRINKIISFNDYVYVFRDYGVSRVSAYGDQDEFSVSQLFVSSTKIYGQSVVSCGDRIIFASRDGLHSFDGYNTSKINLGIEKLFEAENNDNSYGVFFQNKYYLACRLNFDDSKIVGCEGYSGSYQNNALIEYDIKTGDKSILRGVDIRQMVAIEESNVSKLAAIFNGQYKNYLGQLDHSGTIFGQATSGFWQSPRTNLGYPGQTKIVKQILLNSLADCIVTITTEIESKSYQVKGKNTTQKINTHVVGEMIQVSFESQTTSDIIISKPQIVVGVVG